MADESNTSETEETETTTTEEENKDTPSTETDKGTPDIAAMQAALKKANREAASARNKLKEIEDAGKSETDKLRDEKTTAEKERDEARHQALRLEVAISKKLPMSLAIRLQGDSKEEMEADADSLLKELKPGAPSGDADQGRRGKEPDAKNDMNKLLHAAARGGG